MKFFLALFFFLSCQQNSIRKGNELGKLPNTLSSIRGTWGGETGTPVWLIKDDSIYYYSENRSYYYFVHENDLIVLYKEGPFMLKNIHSVYDTLFFENEGGGLIRAFRPNTSPP